MLSYKFKKKLLEINGKDISFEHPIYQVTQYNQTILVLLHPDSNKKNGGQFPNLIGVSLEGELLWQAELPTTDTGDCYYKIQKKYSQVVAYSWCSYTCIIDPKNGKIVEKIFTK